jgi:hypothetical protein
MEKLSQAVSRLHCRSESHDCQRSDRICRVATSTQLRRGCIRLAHSALLSTAAATLVLLCACLKKAEEVPADTSAAVAPAPAPMDTGMAHMDTAASSPDSGVAVEPSPPVHPVPASSETIQVAPGVAIREMRAARAIEMRTAVAAPRAAPMVVLPLPRESLPTPTIIDSALVVRAHAADSVSALERAMDELRTARVSFDSPDTLVVDEPAEVSVVITPGSGSPVSGAAGGPPVRPDTTRISDVTQVCLSAPGFRVQNEAAEEKACREQPVSRRNPSKWTWILTPLSQQIGASGRRPVKVTVNAILPGYSPYTVYSSVHSTFVQVKAPSRMQRVQKFLDEWKALLLSLAAIIGVLVPVFRWLRSRQK